MTYDNRHNELRLEDAHPEILQYSLKPPPPAQVIMEHMARPDEERLIALAEAYHPRLGRDASPLAGLFDHTPELRDLILGLEGMDERRKLRSQAGYKGPAAAGRSRATL